jgi:hypothetical protein
VRISSNATWTLNGLAGGYCRYLTRVGVLEAKPEPGPYQAVLEAIECFVGLTSTGFTQDREGAGYDFTSTGRRYMSARR